MMKTRSQTAKESGNVSDTPRQLEQLSTGLPEGGDRVVSPRHADAAEVAAHHVDLPAGTVHRDGAANYSTEDHSNPAAFAEGDHRFGTGKRIFDDATLTEGTTAVTTQGHRQQVRGVDTYAALANAYVPHDNDIFATRIRPVGSPKGSVRSTASSIARIRQAEYEAEKKLFELQQQQLQLKAQLIKKRLAAQIATIEAEEEEAEEVDALASRNRVQQWLYESSQGPFSNLQKGEKSKNVAFEEEKRSSRKMTDDQVVQPVKKEVEEKLFEVTPRRTERPRSPTPTRRRSPGKGIEQLAEVLEKIVRTRPPPRQASELPIFSGAPEEWLPFKAAMRDSTKIYSFSATENLARLRTCLKGEARKKVQALLFAATDPEKIMNTLERCYGRPESIVNRTIQDIKALPKISGPGELNDFAVKLENIVTVLDTVDDPGYLNNPMLVREIVNKLSPHMMSRWCDFASEEKSTTKEPEVVTLSRFLNREADRMARYTEPYEEEMAAKKVEKKPTPPAPIRQDRKKVPFATSHQDRKKVAIYNTNITQEDKKCPCCGGEHRIEDCSKMKNLGLKQRWDWAREGRFCYRCLVKKHSRRSCKAKRCGVDGCEYNHHSLLHYIPGPLSQSQEKLSQESGSQKEAVMSVATGAQGSHGVLLKVCPIIVEGPAGSIPTYALLDEGSTVTIINEDLAKKLQANGPEVSLHIHGVSSSSREDHSKRVQLRIRGRGSDQAFDIQARTVKDLQLHCQSVPNEILKYEHLKDLKPTDVCFDHASPSLLIGTDNWHLAVTRELKTGKRTEPIASRTNLGWVIHGIAPRSLILKTGGETMLHIWTREQQDDQLDQLVKQHFEVDALGISIRTKENPDDRRARDAFEKTARKVNGRYEVGLPWREDNPIMPPSYDAAYRRLKSIERKMDHSGDFAKEYKAQIDNLLDQGYAVPFDGTEEDSPVLWYLPHFAVRNPNKPGKVRLVFDAAAKVNNTSLNDKLLEGPDLLQDLLGILFKFREKPIAVTADIKEMFLQVKIRQQDQPAQAFLWRSDDRSGAPKKYKMTSMIFGATSSPFLAHSVRNRNAEDHRESHPDAVPVIQESHYMDDLVESFEDEATAKRICQEVDYVHRQIGFILRGWSSNSQKVLEDFPEDLRTNSLVKLGNVKGQDKTLGLLWDAHKDELGFNTAMNRVSEEVRRNLRIPTKREALSAVMSIFDPLGLLSQYVIRAKIALQQLWKLKIGWDDPLPDEPAEIFRAWINDLESVSRLRIPRCYVVTPYKKRELHVFCDASEQAYAAVAYWKIIKMDDEVLLRIVAAKAKVAPLKTLTIPRLELQAAVIGVRLAEAIEKSHRELIDAVYFWTDSMTVLHWIRNKAKKYTPFVAHRLGEIDEKSTVDQWKYVPTKENVADDATRCNANAISADQRWYQGPLFLAVVEDEWPMEPKIVEQKDQEEKVLHIHHGNFVLPDISRFSSYDRLIRATARVLQFIDRCRRKATELELHHIESAEKLWMAQSQRDHFAEEIKDLQEGNPISRKSKLWKLDPILEGGLLRLRGRIEAADTSPDMKKPIILDGKHKFTQLLLRKEHATAGHGNLERVVNEVRQKYWVLKLRPAAKKAAKDCAICKIRQSQPRRPPTGDLPAARLSPFMRPFSNCGVDYFGPMTVTIGRRHEKRWGALFTCLTTRAIHLELVHSLSTDSAIMAIRRMAARRGWPRIMYSDNGTNFRGADAELRAAYKGWMSELKNFGLDNHMEWRFIPPGAPHQGGCWERLVRSVKVALNATLKEKSPKEELLLTLLAEAEQVINSRPLTHVSVDARDPEALTPNHFLLGNSSGVPITGNCGELDRKAWKRVQAWADHFWKRWMKEYLPTLSPRGESARNESDVKEGDVVIIADSTLPRNVWPRGIVEKTYPGPDGHVRSADVKTVTGVFRRPTTKIIVLNVDGS